MASNAYYNDALEKAAVRDLSGAIESLRTSLRFYKMNIDARNLLGLVYFRDGRGGRSVDGVGHQQELPAEGQRRKKPVFK